MITVFHDTDRLTAGFPSLRAVGCELILDSDTCSGMILCLIKACVSS